MPERQPSLPCPIALAAIGVPAKRWSTRADLYRQLSRAKTYLDTSPLEEANLTEAAATAGLSKHHFLRLFREVHSCTPHQYLMRRRLDQAKQLLLGTDLPSCSIAVEVGFQNASAFGRAFRKHVGVAPQTFRKSGATATQ